MAFVSEEDVEKIVRKRMRNRRKTYRFSDIVRTANRATDAKLSIGDRRLAAAATLAHAYHHLALTNWTALDARAILADRFHVITSSLYLSAFSSEPKEQY